jgi:8-oxo-dGTP pyrophosphatase MutT (NUDIX family)
MGASRKLVSFLPEAPELSGVEICWGSASFLAHLKDLIKLDAAFQKNESLLQSVFQEKALSDIHFIELFRSHSPWHVTASAVVFKRTPKLEFLVLHHAKANEWVYPGGHADGVANLWQEAFREVKEETSQAPLRIWFLQKPHCTPLPDFAQWISINNRVDVSHEHLDVVYCFEFLPQAEVKVDLTESKGYRWLGREDFSALPKPTFKALDFFWKLLS